MSEKGPFYTIGQVAEYFDLPQSVLRYWETVFDALSPMKSPGGSRRYSDRDLKIISEIKHLLYQRGFTIKGANKLLNQKYHIQPISENIESSAKPKRATSMQKKEQHPPAQKKETSQNAVLKKIILELKEIVRELEQDVTKLNLHVEK